MDFLTRKLGEKTVSQLRWNGLFFLEMIGKVLFRVSLWSIFEFCRFFAKKGRGEGALSKRLALGARLSILPLLKVATAARGCGAKERIF